MRPLIFRGQCRVRYEPIYFTYVIYFLPGPLTKETRENKIVIRELVSKWNRPVYGQDASYRAMRSMQEEPEAIEVTSSGNTSNSARRRMGATWNARKRENPSRDEAVGNILSAAKAG